MKRTWRDWILIVFALQYAWIGVWATFAPASFYGTFPGWGRVWVEVDGPYNEHFVRDVGALFIAIAAISIYALLVRSSVAYRATGLFVAVFSLPHVIYHAATADLLPSSDGLVNTISLALGLALAVALVVSPAPRGRKDESSGAVPPAGPGKEAPYAAENPILTR